MKKKRTKKRAAKVKGIPSNRRISIAFRSLILFSFLSVISFFLYKFLKNDLMENLFFLSSIIFIFIAVAFLIVFLVFLILRFIQKKGK